MIAKIRVGMILILLLLWTAPVLADSNIQEGLWEITIRMEMPGVPSDQMKPVSSTHCLKDGQQIPQILQQDHTCQISNTKTEGDSVSWTMKCQGGEGSMDGSGKMTYKSNRFDGVIYLNMHRPDAGPMKVTQRISGRWVGSCP
jgi:hypothetical protein